VLSNEDEERYAKKGEQFERLHLQPFGLGHLSSRCGD
jgi:hypothetical protein